MIPFRALRLLTLAGALGWAAPAWSQCATLDPVTVSQPYNPLSPNDYVASFSATGRRGMTSSGFIYSALFLRRFGDNRPYQLFVVTDDGGAGGTNLISPPPGPLISIGLDDPGEIDLDFRGFFPPATRTFELQLRIPAGTDWPAGPIVARFDVEYLCESGFNFDSGVQIQGFQMTFPVSSALSATLSGPDQDFGEIGHLSTTAVASSPTSVTERRSLLRVSASGPFELRIESQNSWRMTSTGSQTTVAAERIAYRYQLLGQTLDAGRQLFTPVICRATGVGGQLIPLTATLTEGGLGKIASPTYRDFVTITITPLAVAQGGTAVPCP